MLNERNMSALCLVDGSKKDEFDQLQEILWSALDYFGIPYEVMDLAKAHLHIEALENYSVVIIGQEHLGTSLSINDASTIMEAVKSGVGLVCFDSDLHSYKKPFKDALGLWTSEVGTRIPHLWDIPLIMLKLLGKRILPHLFLSYLSLITYIAILKLNLSSVPKKI